jgi:hypothetical protein
LAVRAPDKQARCINPLCPENHPTFLPNRALCLPLIFLLIPIRIKTNPEKEKRILHIPGLQEIRTTEKDLQKNH